jgi:hypothetical protein
LEWWEIAVQTQRLVMVQLCLEQSSLQVAKTLASQIVFSFSETGSMSSHCCAYSFWSFWKIGFHSFLD